MNETTDILTEEDIILINDFVEKPNLRLLIFALFFTLLSYFASLFLDTYLPLIVLSIFTGIGAAWYFYMRWNINRVLRSGVKKIVTGMIDEKYERTIGSYRRSGDSIPHTFYYFILNGKKFTIPPIHYDQYIVGDIVNLHITNFLEIVFKVTKD